MSIEHIPRLTYITSVAKKGNPFKVGDIITPRQHSLFRRSDNTSLSGVPFGVIHVYDPPIIFTSAASGIDMMQSHFGAVLDIRIVFIDPATSIYTTMAVESWMFESFLGAAAGDSPN